MLGEPKLSMKNQCESDLSGIGREKKTFQRTKSTQTDIFLDTTKQTKGISRLWVKDLLSLIILRLTRAKFG